MDLALNEDVRAELKEALRLLLIYDIIRRYCGISAREYFNVSDIRHGSRLVDFVCTFVSSPHCCYWRYRLMRRLHAFIQVRRS